MKPHLAFVSVLLCAGALVGCNASNPPRQTVATEAMSQQGARTEDRARAKIHTELGTMYFQAGNVGVALEELRIAVESDPTYAPAYNMLGLVHGYLRELGPAEENFRRALAVAPNDPEVANNYGWFLCQGGREREAIPYFLQAVKNPLYTTPDKSFINAGECAAKMKDDVAAMDYFDKALRYDRNNVKAMVGLAGSHYRKGDVAEARRLVAKAHTLTEPTAESLWLAARIEHKLGNRDEEVAFATQLHRRFPNSQEYQAFLRQYYD